MRIIDEAQWTRQDVLVAGRHWLFDPDARRLDDRRPLGDLVLDELRRLPNISEALWLAVRGNLQMLADVARWQQVVTGPVAPVIEDAPFLTDASDKLLVEPWDDTTWKN